MNTLRKSIIQNLKEDEEDVLYIKLYQLNLFKCLAQDVYKNELLSFTNTSQLLILENHSMFESLKFEEKLKFCYAFVKEIP